MGADREVCGVVFRKRTGYGIMPSLVGSEMCIRDRCVYVGGWRACAGCGGRLAVAAVHKH